MARILLTSMPFAGHVGPLSALTAELRRRGHRVVAHSGHKYRDRFVGAGAEWTSWRAARDFDDSDLAATFPEVGDGKGMRGGKANVEQVLLGTAAGQARDLLDVAHREPFDLIVADQLAFGGALAGERLGLPWVSVAVTPLTIPSRDLAPSGLPFPPSGSPVARVRDAVLRHLVRLAQRRFINPRLDRARAEVGLGPAPAAGLEGLYSPYLVLAQGVPGLEYPRSDLPGQVRFVGRLAPPPGPAATRELPSWWPELAAARAAGRPVVHVTQGTLDVDPADLLRPAIDGLAGHPALVVATTGRTSAATLGGLPDNARVAPFLPHDLLLPLVDVMVTNGGWGGVLGAVQAGVPLVVAGDSLDKPEVARRVAWSGVGLDLRTGRPAAAKVRGAVERVLGEQRFRARAGELGAALTAAGGPAAAGDLIENLLAGAAEPSPR
ncbi:glycosyltransferase [Micromonospora sp. PLK6-60]|uniref:glycosyltransferase n=1 Tax=Micromonospora sp. PLK6-60 TaxID=2873383 RepID=UPI001CA6B829|nr:glycosyltransferase [Micromonospora sp. PLK6-60]MBY8875413.1 glycosyltransferase [Micromonospora sp. PLK6-60]